MRLSPREKDKLLVAMAATVARRRLDRGVKLNHPEAVALISDFVVEGARDGRSVAELMRDGALVLTRDQVMAGIAEMIPGEIIVAEGEIVLNAGRQAVTLKVANTGDRPVQVGSHYHFFETNAALSFDRAAARGHRLDIPAGTALRFEPGMSREVTLIPYAGNRVVYGFNAKIQGKLES